MSLTIRELEAVEAIATTGSATQAAEVLGVSQPAVSQIVRKLEEDLGSPVFHRSAQGMTLTELGERLLRSARIVLGELDRFEREMELVRKSGKRDIRLASQCYAFHQWLPDILERFSELCPGSAVRVEGVVGRDLLRALREGRLDVAVVDAAAEGDELVSEALFEDELVVLVADRHPLAAKDRVGPEDFAGHVLLVHGDDRGRWLQEGFLAGAGTAPRRVLELEVTEALVGTARAGLGAAVLPRWAAERGRRRGMTVRPLAGTRARYGWYVTVRSGDRDDPAIRRLLELVRSNAPPSPPTGSTPGIQA